jgi:hypothetical protein
MAHGLIKATIILKIVCLIEKKYSANEALEMFNESSAATSLTDDETGPYGKFVLYIFSIISEKLDRSRSL